MSETRGENFVMESDSDAHGPISFSTFVLGLASTALIHLGEAPNPDTGSHGQELLMAKQTLSLLDMLREKTKGNLTADEEKLFQSLLTDLRLKFVAASK